MNVTHFIYLLMTYIHAHTTQFNVTKLLKVTECEQM